MKTENPHPLRALFGEFPEKAILTLEDLGPGQAYTGWWTPLHFARSTQDQAPVVIVRAGRLRACHPDDREAKSSPLAVLEEGRIWVEPEQSATCCTFAASPHAVVSVIPRPAFDMLCRTYPAVQAEARRQLDEHVLELRDRWHERCLTLEERLLRELGRWGVRQHDGGIRTERLTQEMLAGLLGACRESVSRLMAMLKKTGRLKRLEGGRYVIPTHTSASAFA